MDLREGEKLEFKERWTDRAVEDLAAFANHQGGILLVGVDDDGTPVGFKASDAELRRITDQAADVLGLAPAVRRRRIRGREVLELAVEPMTLPVACRGRYIVRVGSTNREMAGEEVARRFLERTGQSWDCLLSAWGLDHIAPDALARFVRTAQPRLPALRESDPPEKILGNLGLFREERLTNAGVLLFAREPQRLFPLAQIRLARFPDPLAIEDDRTCAGNLFDQLDGAMAWLREHVGVRYEVRTEVLTLEGLQRNEVWTWPHEAVREALINAVMHRDYIVPADIQVRRYPDELRVWNGGRLHGGITLANLRMEGHPSVPHNPAIAQTFFFAGLVEKWGSGTTRMISQCRRAGVPEPEFALDADGIRVTFRKDHLAPERLAALGLPDRQVQAILYSKEHGRITNSVYRQQVGVSRQTASADLDALVTRGLLVRAGNGGRGAHYVLNDSGMPKMPDERPESDQNAPRG
jgi:ATP-dependent DNA helicase RecG